MQTEVNILFILMNFINYLAHEFIIKINFKGLDNSKLLIIIIVTVITIIIMGITMVE